MTIKEYKLKFIELFEQMEKEHGVCDNIHIEHTGDVHSSDGRIMASRYECRIKF